jgi:PAS domain S-box-containing protein
VLGADSVNEGILLAIGAAGAGALGVLTKTFIDYVRIRGDKNKHDDEEAVKAYRELNHELRNRLQVLEGEIRIVQGAEAKCREDMARKDAEFKGLRRDFETLRVQMSFQQVVSQAVIDVIEHAVICIDERGIVWSWNPAATLLLGWMPSEIMGQSITKLMPRDIAKAHQGYIDHYLRTGEAKIIGHGREVEAVHRDGYLIRLELSVSVLPIMKTDRKLFTGILRPVRDPDASDSAIRKMKPPD